MSQLRQESYTRKPFKQAPKHRQMYTHHKAGYVFLHINLTDLKKKLAFQINRWLRELATSLSSLWYWSLMQWSVFPFILLSSISKLDIFASTSSLFYVDGWWMSQILVDLSFFKIVLLNSAEMIVVWPTTYNVDKICGDVILYSVNSNKWFKFHNMFYIILP